jgi:hypothetical protein
MSSAARAWAAGVVAGAHDEAAVHLAPADERRHGGGGHDGVLAHHNLADAVGCGQLQDDLRQAKGKAGQEQARGR